MVFAGAIIRAFSDYESAFRDAEESDGPEE
jgi:hypothetical protein